MASSFIDTERYPLEQHGSAARAELISRCRASLGESGASVLEGFVRPAAVSRIVEEIEPVIDRAYYKTKVHNVYLTDDDPSLGPTHPRNAPQTTSSATLAYDCVPNGGVLDSIYHWAPLRELVAETLGFEALHPYADPLTPVNVLVYQPGTQTGWHFDIAEFVVTLLLRSAEGGGAYDYAPFIRDETTEGFDAVGAVLAGERSRVRRLSQPEGALVIFRGHHTLHRVTAVEGRTSRLVGVFSYAPRPGMQTNAYNRKTFYGRSG